ncbi:MAG: hypothetical protein HOH95_02085, partial [Dehalococcoidia bacterium]|nr:hypothetical protein [Dehalococcoidia bacterium]
MTDQQTDSTDSAENTVSRRKFMEGLGLTAAGASAGVVIGVALPVGSEAASLPAQPTDVAWPADQSIRPQLTPISQLQPAADDEQHIAYAPALPAPAARSDQRTYDVHIESIEGDCSLDPANGITTEMWGFRIAGDTEVNCGSPGPVLRGRVG